MKDKKDAFQIRNSTIDFLVFTKQNSEDGIEVRVHDENVWLTQKNMARLFDCSSDNISLHLKNIFKEGELVEEAVTEKSSATASDGKNYMMKFYNLDAIISVGYRINSIRATQFRQWATKILKTYTVQGYVLDKKRLENGKIFDEEYFEHLLDEIREIRASERKFYQKITDIYATSVDYAERQARKHIPMSMEDWARRLDLFLELNEETILEGKGNVTAEFAKRFAEEEFDKYREIQDSQYQSDFDRLVNQMQ